MTGITREDAARIAAEYFGTSSRYLGEGYDSYAALDTQDHQWKFVSDASITPQRKNGRRTEAAPDNYKTGMVSSAPVLIWKINSNDEEALTRYERYPHFYRQEMLAVELDGKPVNAMVYIMNDGHEYGAPSDDYLGTIAEDYDSAGFDTELLDAAVEKSIRLAQEQQALENAQYNLWEQKWW